MIKTRQIISQLNFCKLFLLSRKGAKGRSFNVSGSFATRFWQDRNAYGLLCIGRSTQRKLRNFKILDIELQ